MIWRWRWELGLVAGSALMLWASWLATGAWVLVIAPVVVSTLTLIQPCQRLLARRGSAIAVQHRIRRGCSEGELYGPDGGLPAVLWTRVVPHGERVYLWRPPTLTVDNFRAERQRLAQACRSQSVWVGGHSRSGRIVVMDVVRRGSGPTTGTRTTAGLRSIPRPRQNQEA